MPIHSKGVHLAGARILLTGASSGIGRALARHLADAGARLVVAARRAELLDDLCDEVTARGGRRPLRVPTDLAAAGAADALATTALEHFEGGVDMLINNAGASLIGGQARIGADRAARDLFEVNLWAPLALTAALVPAMLAQGSGAVVNVTSTIQAVPLPLLGYYGSSKSALAQATRALRLELADTPISVVEVVPGATDTALRDIDELPWKSAPPRTLPPVSPDASAQHIVRRLRRGGERIVYPSYSLAPLELPALGRLIARIGGRRVDKSGAV